MTADAPEKPEPDFAAEAHRLMRDDGRGFWEDMPAAAWVRHLTWRDEVWNLLERIAAGQRGKIIAQVRRDALEEAAKIAEGCPGELGWDYHSPTMVREVAARIRAAQQPCPARREDAE